MSVTATHYVTPLREGGSFPGLVAAHERLAGPATAALAGAAAAVPGAWLPEGGSEPYVECLRRRLAWGAFAAEADGVRR